MSTPTADPPGPWPHRVGVIPPLAHCRQFRPADALLAGAVALDGGGAVPACQVLAGLGGVGKTQLAANLADRWWRERRVDLLVWVTATSRSGVVTGLAQCADEVLGVTGGNAETAAARMLTWLATTDRSWLVVLDDVADPGDLAGLWPPATPTGRTVVTTRRRDAALMEGRQVIEVELFTPDEAVAYLTVKLAAVPQLADDLPGLAADLGHLPIALAQAAAYLIDRDVTCTGFRRRLSTKVLHQLRPLSLPDQHQAIVAATWELSIALADQLTPPGVAGWLLQVAALLDPNGIPAGLFTADPVRQACTARLGEPIDADDIRDALRVLDRLSLAALDSGTLRVHTLIQRAVRDAVLPYDRARLAQVAADGLLAIWPEPERDASHAQALRANAAALAAASGSALWNPGSGGHALLAHAGNSLGTTGLVTAAANYFRQLHATAVERLGPDHPDTLTVRHTLAHWQDEAGGPADTTAFADLLADHLRVLGPDHPSTLSARHSVARWLGRTGDAAGAVAAFEELLTDYLRVLGPDHPNTLITRNNLAHWRGEAGDAAGAVAAFEDLVTDYLRVLGPDHLNTLAARHNVARWRGKAGDATGAVTAFETLLADYLRVLGPDHPNTLAARHNLAYWRGTAGDPAGAAVAFEELLTDYLRVLGPDHPHTRAARRNLERWAGAARA
ncbi:tetratricopeptide repeat protein [Dactylosporangium sp. NPDC005572]|uniref:tetratricopeptide repeat protein n=1 Tax=Dactylosporangium sp. NPDC005572 TaxID=3156889 RepID=UPI0033A52F94